MVQQRTGAAAAVAAATLTLLAALTACDSDNSNSSRDQRTGTLEALASRAGCTHPDMGTDAGELRQANCTTKQGRYVVTTFTTDRGQREWINDAKAYGGTYLVGRKWVVSGDEGAVKALRDRLGGTLEEGEGHGTPGHHGV